MKNVARKRTLAVVSLMIAIAIVATLLWRAGRPWSTERREYIRALEKATSVTIEYTERNVPAARFEEDDEYFQELASRYTEALRSGREYDGHNPGSWPYRVAFFDADGTEMWVCWTDDTFLLCGATTTIKADFDDVIGRLNLDWHDPGSQEGSTVQRE